MKLNRPVVLTDKEIEAIENMAALVVVQANNGNGPRFPHLISAVLKLEKSRQGDDIEIPAERLKLLE